MIRFHHIFKTLRPTTETSLTLKKSKNTIKKRPAENDQCWDTQRKYQLTCNGGLKSTDMSVLSPKF